ncbi:hypothetical protein [Streptacidiphilus anmyonensis]|uniref:hypothetical protein n=1 Tax=Streptacidiphilus anmyonensis TaxID=405782 RepID=UPI0005A8158F|nr:hypothetical protein [Streptacidiphilus anmyonensis]
MSVTAQRAAEEFLNRTMWQREGRRRPDPFVALLAPRGSGKSAMLRMLSQECGGSVVHSILDCATLPKGDDVIPVAANRIAFDMTRAWQHLRQPPSFHRFRLAYLARDVPALPADRTRALQEMGTRIQEYADSTRAGRASARTAQAAQQGLDLAADLTSSTLPGLAKVVPPARDTAKALTRLLSQRASLLGVRKGIGYHGRTRSAESADPIDALIALSQARPKDAAAELMDALVADLEANAQKGTIPVSCHCRIPADPADRHGRSRHHHAWVLLVDNAQTESGRAFLAALAAARQRRASSSSVAVSNGDGSHAPGPDPLLVIAAFNQWQDEWRHHWLEPWATASPGAHRAAIPTFSQVNRAHWEPPSTAGSAAATATATATATAAAAAASAWLPVWLDGAQHSGSPGTPRSARNGGPVDEATGLLCAGHRGGRQAFEDALDQDSGHHRLPHPRPLGALMLRNTDHEGRVAPLWRHGLAHLSGEIDVPDRHWVNLPDTVAAAAYLTDPRAVEDARLPAEVPGLNGTLQSLRKHLWVSAVTSTPAEARTRDVRRAVLHPWLRECLLAGLAYADSLPGPNPPGTTTWPSAPNDTWRRAFQRLRPPDAAADRQLFHDLALHQFDGVARVMAATFDQDRHSVWVERLWYVTSAPTALPLHETVRSSYERLVDQPRWRTDVEAPTAKLVLLLWLYNDPLTEADGYWDEQIAQAFRGLAGRSTQSDVDALLQAAARFSH